ncbi:hypothetical protein DASB73_040710 [Starmerella bacillaris]|uniref:Uncharacterized protein n=1 Tax=Starmerella bacillaris TaxID=1247836 RepID=A0AAV5RPK1_STABA|nr:hypothetical protein DASB73_040710 [Starmerella bacillaris]
MDFSHIRLTDFAAVSLHAVPARVVEASTAADPIARSPEFTMYFSRVSETHCVDACGDYTLSIVSGSVVVTCAEKTVFTFAEEGKLGAVFIPERVPGLMVLNYSTGTAYVWKHVTKAFFEEPSKLFVANDVSVICPVFPVGVLCASGDKFHLVRVYDDLNKFKVSVSQLNFGMFFGMRSRMRDFCALKPGKSSSKSCELLVANKHGDVGLCHLHLNGVSNWRKSVSVGSLIHMHMNILYPTSGTSLRVHDVAYEAAGFYHALASFEPEHASRRRYFVVATFDLNFEVVSVHRLQSYESDLCMGHIYAAKNTLVIANDDAIVLLDSPSKQTSPRWEECISFKPGYNILRVSDNVQTNRGIVQIELNESVNHSSSATSTTKSRLEMAVFDSSDSNPLDLSKWPSYAFKQDVDAPKVLALEIANATSPFVPQRLGNLGAHFDLRLRYLNKLYALAPEREVSDLIQLLLVAKSVYQFTLDPSLQNQEGGLLDSLAGGETDNIFSNDVLKIPSMLVNLPSTYSHIVCESLEAMSSTLPVPKWCLDSRYTAFVQTEIAKHTLSPELAGLVKLLCRLTPVIEGNGIPNLITHLATFEPAAARSIAREFGVWESLAPLEMEVYSRTNNIDDIRSLMRQPEFATELLNFCIERRMFKFIIQLTPDPEVYKFAYQYLVDRELYNVAWTLAPGSSDSLYCLEKAAWKTTNFEQRKVLGSLLRLGGGSSYIARLCAAEEAIRVQYVGATSTSALVKTALNHLDFTVGACLAKTKEDIPYILDLLALSPIQIVTSTYNNFVLGFQLVEDDIASQSLLAHELLLKTDWSLSAETGDYASNLFHRTLGKVPGFKKLVLRAHKLGPAMYSTNTATHFNVANPEVRLELEDIGLKASEIQLPTDME